MGFPRVLTVGELVRGSAVRAGPGVPAGPVLVEVGITELRARRAVRLSGGQQQSVALAMALVGDPDLLLLDESTDGLGMGRICSGRSDTAPLCVVNSHNRCLPAVS